MKVFFLCEYFFPFDRGGSEWSVYHLAKFLVRKGHKVTVFTPNYGAKSQEKFSNIEIVRFPYYLKLKNTFLPVTPLHFSHPVWFLWTIFCLFREARREKPEVLHVQGKYFIPQAVVVGKLLRIPVIVTLRDYIVLCPLAYCIRQERNYQACSLVHLITSDMRQYFIQFHFRNKFYQFVVFIGALYGWWVSCVLRFCLHFVNYRVAISKKLLEIYHLNGLPIEVTVYNSFSPVKIVAESRETTPYFLYVGRLTSGKGFPLLLAAYSTLNISAVPCLKVIGSVASNKYVVPRGVELLGHLPYTDTLDFIARATLVIVPSVWEEPFGRVALEAQMLGVPVVTTNRGGLPEIVEDKLTGVVVEPTPDSLRQGIHYGLKNHLRLRQNLVKRRHRLEAIFTHNPVDQHIKLYRHLI